MESWQQAEIDNAVAAVESNPNTAEAILAGNKSFWDAVNASTILNIVAMIKTRLGSKADGVKIGMVQRITECSNLLANLDILIYDPEVESEVLPCLRQPDENPRRLVERIDEQVHCIAAPAHGDGAQKSPGVMAAVAIKYDRNRSSIGRVWARHVKSERAGVEGGDHKSHMKGNVGRKPLNRDELVAKVRAVPIEQRQNQRQLAAAAGVSRRIVGVLLRDGLLTRVTDRIKPTLTEANRIARLQFALAHLDESTLQFEAGFDVVHVDEKWFNEDKDNRAYLLLDGEKPPPRDRKSKRFIPKTMFLAAVARPRRDHSTGMMFDGKIGLWPLTETFVAQRKSVNREKGAICTRNVATVDRQLYKHYIVDHVIPAIKAKWPVQDRRRTILIQQDNATPHVLPSDPDVVAAGTADGWNIRLLFQPPNSPDLNVLDLGFFASIQSIQYRQTTRGIENLIRAVTDAFEETSVTTLENIFITLQCVMQCIMEKEGGNRFSLPHIGKEALRKKGELPERITCDSAVYDLAVSALERAGQPMLF